MKKYLFLLLIVFMFPIRVFAEDLQREGVYYFFTYPNGLEVVSENYQDTVEEEEILLYSGATDSDGEVVLEGWNREGEIRIVEKVPNGYSVESKEITVDLSSEDSVEFINSKEIINPKTGRSILLIVEVLLVLFGFYLLISRRKKVKFLLLFIISFVLLLTSVNAEQDDFVIIVKDKNGDRLSNVEVEVYAKAASVEAHPAIKINVNGGYFLDGEDEMYMRLPYDDCYVEDMLDFNYEEYIDSYINYSTAYNPGSILSSSTFPDYLNHGEEYDLYWTSPKNPEDLSSIDFNGGNLLFRGKTLTNVTTYTDNSNIIDYHLVPRVRNHSLYLIGYDVESSCGLYNQYGIVNDSQEFYDMVGDSWYLCWNKQPDGIYVNDSLFVGNQDSCFIQSSMYLDYGLQFYDVSYMKRVIFYDFSFPNDISLSMLEIWGKDPQLISSLKIVENGEVIFSLNENDLTFDQNNSVHTFSNSTLANRLINYFSSLNSICQFLR